MHRLAVACAGIAIDDRTTGIGRVLVECLLGLSEPLAHTRLGQVHALGVQTIRAIQLGRNGDEGVTIKRRRRLERTAGHIGGGHILIKEGVHERGVGAVLQKTPHQIGQQVLMAAHRSVDAHRAQIRIGLRRRGVERLPHAVQALEFIGRIAGLGRNLTHGAQGVGVMGRKLREDGVRGGQHLSRTGQIVEIGRRLGGPDREVRLTVHLGELDLGIPIGAFHQAHHEPTAGFLAELDQLLEHAHGALLISLDDDPEAVPARQRGLAREPVEDFQLNDQAIAFLGVEAEAQIRILGHLGQLQRARIELFHHLRLTHGLIARMQGGQLHADAVHILDRALLALLGHHADGVTVFVEIALGVLFRAGALAQHVKAEERLDLAIGLPAAAALDRALDVAAQNELLAQDSHGALDGGPDDGFAQTSGHLLEVFARILLGARIHLENRTGHHQADGRRIDQPVIRFPGMLDPGAGPDLLGDEIIGRFRVRNPQQRLGQTHQGQAFLVAQTELLKKALHQAAAMTRLTRLLDELDRGVAGRLSPFRAQADCVFQLAGRLAFISELLAVQCIPIDRYVCPIAHGPKPLEPGAAGASGPVRADNAC